jgi:hypothetical protein
MMVCDLEEEKSLGFGWTNLSPRPGSSRNQEVTISMKSKLEWDLHPTQPKGGISPKQVWFRKCFNSLIGIFNIFNGNYMVRLISLGYHLPSINGLV